MGSTAECSCRRRGLRTRRCLTFSCAAYCRLSGGPRASISETITYLYSLGPKHGSKGRAVAPCNRREILPYVHGDASNRRIVDVLPRRPSLPVQQPGDRRVPGL